MNYLNHPEQNTFFFWGIWEKHNNKNIQIDRPVKKYNLMYWLVCKNIKLKLFIGYLLIYFFNQIKIYISFNLAFSIHQVNNFCLK